MLTIEDAIVAGLVVLVACWVFARLIPRESAFARAIFAFVTIALAIRYMSWRWSDTLPAFDGSVEAVYSWGFLGIETIVMITAFVSSITLIPTRNRSQQATDAAERFEASGRAPRVHVFIPTYNESEQILEKTITAATNIEYPNYEVWVLDDSRREWLADLCERLGALHVTRPDNSHAKAGNINHALSVSDAPFVAIFDADFVAHPSFIKRTIGLFEDPKVGIVQTPQFFYNSDPIQHNLMIDKVWQDEQRYFFDVLMPSQDWWGTAFCCGTSSISRRSALDMAGGFPTETVTEDIHLTYRQYEHGYVTYYLHEALSAGLAPEGVGAFLTQRGRWSLGNLQQLHLRSGPFGFNRQSLIQRLHYLNGSLHWMLYPHRLLFIMAPVIFWYTGTPVLYADLKNLLWHFLPMLFAGWVYSMWISRKTLFPVLSDVSHFLVAMPVTKAIYHGLFRPRGHGFKVTPKGGAGDQVVIHWQIVLPAVAAIMLLIGGMALSDVLPTPLTGRDGQSVNVLWSLVNIALLLLVAMAAVDRPRYRQEERFELNEEARLITDDGARPIPLADMSLSGFSILAPERPGVTITLEVPDVGAVQGTIARSSGNRHGYQLEPLDPATRRRLIGKLFTSGYRMVGDPARSRDILSALWRRIWYSPRRRPASSKAAGSG